MSAAQNHPRGFLICFHTKCVVCLNDSFNWLNKKSSEDDELQDHGQVGTVTPTVTEVLNNVQTVAPQAFKCILELSLVKIYATFITAFKLAKSDAVSENS